MPKVTQPHPLQLGDKTELYIEGKGNGGQTIMGDREAILEKS